MEQQTQSHLPAAILLFQSAPVEMEAWVRLAALPLLLPVEMVA